MDEIIIAVIAVLCYYPICVLTLMKLFKTKPDKRAMIVWNFVIVLLPYLGAGVFWLYYLLSLKRKQSKTTSDATVNICVEKENTSEKSIETVETETEYIAANTTDLLNCELENSLAESTENDI